MSWFQGAPHTIPEGRAACACGSRQVHWTDKGGQRTAYCDDCGQFVYCVPGHEIGEGPRKPRSSSAETVDPTQRFRILHRDLGACVLCRSTDGPLEVDHLISLSEGRRYPALRGSLGSDENLAAMCRPCNAAKGALSVGPLVMLALHLEWRRKNT